MLRLSQSLGETLPREARYGTRTGTLDGRRAVVDVYSLLIYEGSNYLKFNDEF